MAISVIDAIAPAVEHTKQQLLKPFRFGQWARLALVGFLTAGPGGCRVQFPGFSGSPSSASSSSVRSHLEMLQRTPLALFGLVALVAVVVALAILIGVIFLYINSRMQFVLFDSVIAKECRIREFWRRRSLPGLRYFAFQIGLIAVVAGIAIMPLFVAVITLAKFGWLSAPRQHVPGLIAAAAIAVLWLLALGIAAFAVVVLARDFVVPQMALEDLDALEGWRRLWAMMAAEKGAFAGYLGIRLLLSIAVGIALTVVAFVIFLILLVPAGALGVAALFGGAVGLTWNLYTIGAAVLAGAALLFVLFCAVAFASVPAIIFFPAYAIYFFADRYAPLANLVRRP